MAKLKFKVYCPGDSAIFKVNSTIVYGDKEAWLVDAQFQKSKARELADEIKALGKKLTLVFISYNDPDYYFGLEAIKEAFPEAKVVSTAQTAWLIRATKDEKLEVWKDKLGDDAPSKIIVPEAVKELPLLEGEKVEIRKNDDDPAHCFLWIPSEKTVLGGVYLTENRHPWLADTHSIAAVDAWIKGLEAEIELKPERVIASHFAKDINCGKVLGNALAYMKAYREAVSEGSNADDVVSKMKAQFPDYEDEGNLEFGAKVIKGEAQWTTRNLYPGIGRHVIADFSPTVVFDLDFHDDKTMTFIGTDGVWKGYQDTVGFTAEEVADNVFMVYWQEANGMAVVHVQNWNTKDVWTNIYAPGEKHESYHMKGTLTLKKEG